MAIKCCPYASIVTGAGNWGANSQSSRDFITIGQRYRVRQAGTISQVSLYCVYTTKLASLKIKVWRKVGTNSYDLVGESEDIAPQLTAATTCTVTLSTPITGVQEGDYYGYYATWVDATSSGHLNFQAATSQTGVITYLRNGSEATTTGHAWESETAASGSAMPIELYASADPSFVAIGDSIIAGHPAHYSYLETTATNDPASTIERYLSALWSNVPYQNMGIGGQNTTQISARFAADLVALSPEWAVLEGGVNDLAQSVAKATFIANWTAMLDACETAGIKPIVLKILPWTNGTTGQMQARDEWNADLAALAAGYTNAVIVDASSRVGKFRTGGDTGNLWNIKTEYDSDGVHFNAAGHEQIAISINESMADTTAPTLSYAERTAAGPNKLVIGFSEAIALVGSASGVTIKHVESDTIQTATAVVDGDPTTVVATFPYSLSEGTYQIAIAAGTFEDTADEPNALAAVDYGDEDLTISDGDEDPSIIPMPIILTGEVVDGAVVLTFDSDSTLTGDAGTWYKTLVYRNGVLIATLSGGDADGPYTTEFASGRFTVRAGANDDSPDGWSAPSNEVVFSTAGTARLRNRGRGRFGCMRGRGF